MALSKDEVIKMVNEFIAGLHLKHDIRGAYLFGSYAKGTPTEYSDVDLAIVLVPAEQFEESPFDESFRIFHEAQKYNSLLEVVCFGMEEFDQDGGALVKRIKAEGIKLM
jgi:predicted nucleotidyltransferase